jgi:hypothetical protein
VREEDWAERQLTLQTAEAISLLTIPDKWRKSQGWRALTRHLFIATTRHCPTLAVFREHRRHPHRIVDPKPDEPAAEQVAIELSMS